MNKDFLQIVSATPAERRDLFLATAARLGTTGQNVEKDFWVCWVLDALFNGLPTGGPRLLFKGGTSLSKAFGLISRFSEDIDITVFRDDLQQAATVEELEALSRKKRNGKLDEIKAACRRFIGHQLVQSLEAIVERTARQANVTVGQFGLSLDTADPDGQSLLVWYPVTTSLGENYVRQAVKIESGAKSALDPNRPMTIRPYIADDVHNLNLDVPGVTTVDASRTFWDKVIVMHGQRRWFERRGELPHQGQRVSRHYYDVYRMLESETGSRASADEALALDCVRHARMFFDRPDFNLASAVPGTLTLSPTVAMVEILRRDYVRMSEMIIGQAPPFDDVLHRIARFEREINTV